MKIIWDREKNESLKTKRNISFEQIEEKIATGNIIEIFQHPNKEKYPNQTILLLKIDNYIYAVPCVIKNNEICLRLYLDHGSIMMHIK